MQKPETAATYAHVRQASLALAAPLSAEDCCVQSMPDASPVKWHLAHTTWFFETFVLEPHEPRFAPFHPAFRVLFNSYYQGVGARHPRAQRGLITRPGLQQVLDYRAQVDARMQALLAGELDASLAALIALGLQPGPRFKDILERIQTEQLEGRILDRGPALEYLKALAAETSA